MNVLNLDYVFMFKQTVAEQFAPQNSGTQNVFPNLFNLLSHLHKK